MLLFADSYAIISFIGGNKAYKKYFSEHEIITTKMNLLEVYYSVLNEESEAKAEEYFNAFLPKTIEIEDETIKKTAKFRLLHKNRNVSYIDAIGYETANLKKIRFLTGDKAFEQMGNVEFVK